MVQNPDGSLGMSQTILTHCQLCMSTAFDLKLLYVTDSSLKNNVQIYLVRYFSNRFVKHVRNAANEAANCTAEVILCISSFAKSVF